MRWGTDSSGGSGGDLVVAGFLELEERTPAVSGNWVQWATHVRIPTIRKTGEVINPKNIHRAEPHRKQAQSGSVDRPGCRIT
jgi:hypothetical protein